MRLAYLVSHPIQYQAPLLREIARQPGLDLTVLFLSDVSTRAYRDPGFGEDVRWDVPLLDGYRHEFLPTLGRFPYGISRALKRGRFDALWVHGYNHYANVWAIRAAKRLGIKVYLRGESTKISAPRGPLKNFLKSLYLRPLFSLCDGFLYIGNRNREYYESYGVAKEKLFPVPYAVDNAFFQERAAAAAKDREVFRASLGLEPGRPVILFAGKLMERKHPHDLLEAYLRLSPDGKSEPRPYLLFVGNGDQRLKLEAKAASTGWNSIHFLGFKNQTQLPAFYDLCDVFVLPSTHEPWGLAVNEAMNSGKAVIVSDQVGCAPDLVEDGENGYVFPAGNIALLADRLLSVTADPSLARRMGDNGRYLIEKASFQEDIAGLRRALEAVSP